MKLTVQLPNENFLAYPHGHIGLGTPLHLFLLTDTLLAADHDASVGWYERIPGPQTPALIRQGLNRYVFCGEVQQIEVLQQDYDIYYFVLLDCGLPISLIVSDPDAAPEEGDLGQHVPDPGRWLMGVAHLSIDWPDNEIHPMAQAISGTVMDIERLTMRPGPGFGEMRSEEKLQPVPLAPDQVFLTLNVVNGKTVDW